MEYISVLTNSSLFSSIDKDEIISILSCLSATKRTFKKGEYIFRHGENISTVGVVLRGSVHISKDDFLGNHIIVGEVSTGNLFGETYACIPTETLEVNVIASEVSDILFIDIKRILTVCSSSCSFHSRLVHNLLSVLAHKNLMLNRKMDHMAKKTIREKLISYLSAEALKVGSSSFKIPFNRQQLANYLCVDRSAMSNELCKMRDDGLIIFEKNTFFLADIPCDKIE